MKLIRCAILPALCLVVAASAAPARADGVKVTKQVPGGAAAADVFDNPQLLNEAVHKAVHDKRAALEKHVKEFLGRGDLIARGITLYNLNVRVGQPTVHWKSAHEFEVMLKANYLYARSTTPTSLGKWADPAFEVHFDLRLRGGLTLPTANMPRIAVTSMTVSVPHVQVKPRNVAGGVVTTMATIANFFAKTVRGKDLIKSAAQKYLVVDVKDRANEMLRPVNAALAQLQAQGYRVSAASLHAARMLEIAMLGKQQ